MTVPAGEGVVMTGSETGTIRAAVIGTGFIGGVHVGALRRLGVEVAGVLGSSPGRGQEGAAALGVARAYASLEELVGDASLDAVHVTSPNHAHYAHVKAVLAAGKHVICEKPLAMTSAQSAEMAALARDSGKVCAVCYNIRFYPLNQHAHGMVKGGNLGAVRFVTGHYHQDWMSRPTDWNWRAEPEKGGALRSVGDIGTHWVDLVSFVTGLKVTSVLADLTTFLPERQKPLGPVATFADHGGGAQRRGRSRPTMRRPSCCGSRAAPRGSCRPARSMSGARMRCIGTWRDQRHRRPGTASGPITCGSAIATGPTRYYSAMRR